MAELIIRREGKVGWLIFSNLTKRNALTYDIWRRLPEAVAQLERDSAVRVIALRGDGGDFSSGADVQEFEHARDSLGAVSSYNRVVDEGAESLLGASKPTLARIRGTCFGGGVAIALHCDLRICADDAVFAMPAARLGLGISYANVIRLAHVVGPGYAAEILFSGRRVNAGDAARMALVNQAVPSADLDAVFAQWCADIAGNAPLSIAAMKRALVEGYKEPDKRDLHDVHALVDACYSSDDYREGRTAFMQKRKPEFRGR